MTRAPHALHNRHAVRRDRSALLERLKKVEGQVRGVYRMVDEDRYCVEILVQVAAARAALGRVALSLLEDHTRGCVASALRTGQGDQAVTDLILLYRRLMDQG